jgi:beta-RFAP synthase
VAFARSCVEAWRLGDDAACTIEVVQVPGSHAGLGSGTQLGLAVAAGMRQLFRPTATLAAPDAVVRLDTSDAVELARAVGRGRRSCVGVYGFSGGGLIVEGGRFVAADRSSDDDATRPFSPLLARVQLPAAWRCVVFGMRDTVGLHGDAEKQAFASLPPVPREISAELSRLALMELWPAAVGMVSWQENRSSRRRHACPTPGPWPIWSNPCRPGGCVAAVRAAGDRR